MIRFDKVKNMTIDDFVDVLTDQPWCTFLRTSECKYLNIDGDVKFDCKRCRREWLQEEVEENE